MTKLQSYTDKNIVSRAEFARLNGWQRGRVTQLANDGRLVLAPNGKDICVIESNARIEATRDPSKIETVERHAKAREAKISKSDIEVKKLSRQVENLRGAFEDVANAFNAAQIELERVQNLAEQLNNGVGEFLDTFKSQDPKLMQALNNKDADFLERQFYKFCVVNDDVFAELELINE